MSTPTLILGNNKWAIEEDNILGYAVEDRNGSYLPREISFTRGSDATFTDSTGTIKQACWNLLQYSEDFTSGVWGKQNTTITANSTNAPDSVLTADQMFDDTSLNWHRIIYTTSVISGNAYTYSIYLKANTETAVQLNTYNIYASNSFNYANFDLQNGVIGTYANCTPSITNIGNGWYRCSITQTSVVSGTSYLYVTTTNNNPLSSDRPIYAGAGNSFYVWGAQLVQGSDALGYLRTTNRLDMPRVDSSTGTKTFLLEPQRTNLALYSEDFTNAFWAAANATKTSNTETAPDGTLTADTISATANLGQIQGSITGTFAAAYTVSFYIKRKTGTGVINVKAVQNTNTPVTVTNDWTRVSVTATAVSTVIRIGISFETSGDEVYLWGAQLEQGAYPTTYIPTTSATATRVADSFSRNNIYTNGYIGQIGGTWLVELRNNIAYTRDAGGFGISLANNNTTYDFGFLILTNTGGAQRISILKRVSGIGTSIYTTTTDTTKIAIKWNGSTADVFANGTKVVTATSFTTTQMELLTANILDTPKFIQQMKLYSEPLSDAECIEITTL